MSGPFIFSRRRFLQQAGAFSALSLAASMDRLGLSSASAQASDYKALVCLFMFGGNDANNMVIPYTNFDTDYAPVRSLATAVQVPKANLQVITPANLGGLQFGLHPGFNVGPTAAATQQPLPALFNSGKLAVVCNAGTLVEPMTVAQYRANSRSRPANLFSHSDQQQQNMSSVSQASTITSPTGWGGRIADKVLSRNPLGSLPMSLSFSGAQTFGTATQVRTLALPTGASFGFSGDTRTGGSARVSARNAILGAYDGNAIVAASQATSTTAVNSSVVINQILDDSVRISPVDLAFGAPGSALRTELNFGLASQLRAVARMIYNRGSLGHYRHIFFVSIGGFDTHSNQGTTNTAAGQPQLYQQIGRALAAFYQSTVNMGLGGNVTTFTLSDFSRTFKPNGNGTDHAWGGHYMVLGGAVQGNRFYGTYPNLALNGPDTIDGNGRFVPTTSIEQYGATLARWFGVPDVDLAQVFPNLNRFPTANLGFMA